MMAQEKGIKLGKLQVVNGAHLVADVNIGKDKQRQNEGKTPRVGDVK